MTLNACPPMILEKPMELPYRDTKEYQSAGKSAIVSWQKNFLNVNL